MLRPQVVVVDLALSMIVGCGGVAGVWLLRRRSSLSVRNLYPPAVLAVVALATAVAVGWWTGVMLLVPASTPLLAGAAAGWRWRSADLGAGEELRNHELSRRWIWQPAPTRVAGERVYLRGQGELVHDRAWPRGIQYVSMTPKGLDGPRLPLGDGQHIVLFGATGAGKTTTARRLIAASTLAQHGALFVLDQKGDQDDVAQMQLLAAWAGVPFVPFDSQDPSTDRWQPLGGTPDGVAARCVEPVRQSEPYYYDALRRHLDIVCKVLHAAERWPPSVPFLIDCCQPLRYPALLALATLRRLQTSTRRWRGARQSTDATFRAARGSRISPAARTGSRSHSPWPAGSW
jgi:hypothetical protein